MRIAINGMGRIGRMVTRELAARKEKDFELVAVNDLAATSTLLHLLKYDSVHGKFPGNAGQKGDALILDGRQVAVFNKPDPLSLPWKDLGVEAVLECTGKWRSPEGFGKHLSAGAGLVLLSAPPREGDVKMIVMGVNEDSLDGSEEVVSNASCTTNCLALMAKVLHEIAGIRKGYMTTTHSYTSDQNLQDGPHRDLRRARAAGLSIIPTSTGATQSVGKVIPELAGKLDGIAMRVPTANGSVTDLTVELERSVSREEVNQAFRHAAEGEMKGWLEYSDDPLVSVDVIGNSASCIFDSLLTATNGNMAKLVGWYDNEYAYACRMIDLLKKMKSFRTQ